MDYKFSRPKLTEPKVKSKMVKYLKDQPGPNDYWAPTKSLMRNIYDMFIKENLTFILFFIIIVIFLLYRYRIVQNEREYNPENAPSARPTKKINWNALIAQQLSEAEAVREQQEAMRRREDDERRAQEEEISRPKPPPLYPFYPDTGGYLMGGKKRY